MIKYGKSLAVMMLSLLLLLACLVLPNGGPFATEVKAAEGDSYTITFDANGGTFDGGGTTNVVEYADVGNPHVSVVKSDNVVDANTTTGPFYQSAAVSKTVTVPGASSLAITATYRHYSQYSGGTGGSNYYLSIFEGTSTSGTSATNRIAYVSSSSKKTASYTVNGDTTQIWWRNTTSVGTTSDWYGIYVEVIGYDADGNAITGCELTSGKYADPVPSDGSPEHTRFVGWNTAADGSGTTVSQDDFSRLNAGTVLYAQYDADILAQDTSSLHWWRVYGDGSLVIGNGSSEANPMVVPIAPNAQAWPWYSQGYATYVKSISFDGHVDASNNIASMFNRLPNLTDVDLTGFNTAPTTSMQELFAYDTSLESIDVSGLDFTNTTVAGRMFSGCTNLKTVIGLDGKSMPVITGIGYMFQNCTGLESMTITNVNAPALTSLSSMFYGCSNITSVELSGWNTPSLASVDSMFYNCTKLESVNLDDLDVQNLTGLGSFFYNCSSLTNISLENWNPQKVQSMSSMFYNCRALESVDMSGWNVTNLANMQNTFYACSNLTTVDLSGWHTTSALQNLSGTFYNCTKLTSLDLSGWDVSGVTTLYQTFYGDSALVNLDLSDWNIGGSCTSMYQTFYNCSGLQELDVSGWKTGSALTSLYQTFYNCSSVAALDVSDWDTSGVTNMYGTFRGCATLTQLDLSGWAGDKVTTMAYFCYGDSGLTNIILGDGWNAPLLTDLSYAFYNCSGLRIVDLSNLVTTSALRDLAYMFYGTKVESLDISGLDTTGARGYNNSYSYYSYGFRSFHNWEPTTQNNYVTNLKRIKVGPNFRFKTATGENTVYWLKLPASPSARPSNLYDSKWTWENDPANVGYTGLELCEAYDGSKPGWYVWHIDDSVGLVGFDTNGGSIAGGNWQGYDDELDPDHTTMRYRKYVKQSEDTPLYIPGVDDVFYPHWVLKGWNTNPDGSGRWILDLGMEVTDVLVDGEVLMLYAQYDPSPYREYTVYEYYQNSSLDGYGDPAMFTYTGENGATVDAPTHDWTQAGYRTPEVKQVTILDDDSAYVEYYYDRYVYQVQFDKNGEDVTGEMESQSAAAGAAIKLNTNAYEREGYLFTGWNTKADGSGRSYKDGGTIVQSVTEDNVVVTLYAQWEDLGNITFVDGEARFRVRCKANETIVIPDLPAGVTYEIHEVGMEPGWQLVEEYQTEGIIYAAVGAMAGFENIYNATGSGTIDLYKYVIDSMTGQPLPFDEGEFEFALLYEPPVAELARGNVVKALSDTLQQLEIQTNGPVDTEEFLYDEDGNATPNPYYGMAKVSFGPFDMNLWDLLESGISDFTFYIAEINVPAGYEADEPIEVHVHIEDAGSGLLTYTATYWRNGEQIEPIFVNRDTNGEAVQIIKNIAGEGPADTEFSFKVDVFEADGKTYHGVLNAVRYTGDSEDGETFTLESGSNVTMRADQRVVVRIPDGMTYEITENDKAGWSLTSVTNNKGVAVNGEQTDVVFTNAYEVNGLLDLNIHKILDGRDLVDGEFNFELVDENEELVGMTSNDAQGDAKIQVAYSTEDIGKTFNYILREVVTDADAGNGITYDTEDRAVTVVVGSENGEMTFTVTVNGEEQDPIIFTNSYNASTEVVLNGTKVLDGREFREGDEWTFDVTPVDGGPTVESVVIHPYADGPDFDVTIGFTTEDMGGESEKEFTYNITESGHVALVANDKTVWTVKIKVTDNGNGLMRAEVIEGETEMTFTNRVLVTLPSTGANTALLMMLLGLAVVGIGFVYLKKSRKEEMTQ